MITGTALFRYKPELGWQVFDWIPANVLGTETMIKVIHDEKGKPSLLRLGADYIKKPRKGRFCKWPHKLIHWPTAELARLAA